MAKKQRNGPDLEAELAAGGEPTGDEPNAPKPPQGEADYAKSAIWWCGEVDRSHKHWGTYRDRARKVINRFRDERPSEEMANGVVRFNILYSNVETLRPAVYSRVPTPDIRRRFQDKDPVGRVAADVLQRCVQYSIESYDFNGVLSANNEDALLPGFSVSRVVYRPHILKEEQPGPDGKPVKVERKVYEEVQAAYCQWDMVAMARVRRWEKVWWVAFATDMTAEEVSAQFGSNIAGLLQYTQKERIGNEEVDETEGTSTARVWEIWDKRNKKRCFVSPGYQSYLRPVEPLPLDLTGGFPCPKPIWTIPTNGTLIPIPEYLMYQDLALELDKISQRIQILVEALKRRGVYDGQFQGLLAQVATGTEDNQFVPYEQFAQLMDKGGLANVIAEMPIDGIAKVILSLYDYRDRTKQMIYEVTGVADIIRGSSNASETATAQKIKGQWAGLRLQDRKTRFAEFARDLIRLKAEIIAEQFSPETMAAISGIQLLPDNATRDQIKQAVAMSQQQPQPGMPPPLPPPPPEMAKLAEEPTWEEVVALLRNDKLRGFRIDIETDSTVQADADSEKAARTEFLTSVAGFIQQAGPAVQAGYMTPDMAREFLTFGARAFKVGSQLEQSLESWGNQGQESAEVTKAKQMIQQKEQELAERESKVKDAETSAKLAEKDLQIERERLMREAAQLEARELKRQLDMLTGTFSQPAGVTQ